MNGGYNILDLSDNEIVINGGLQTPTGRVQYYKGDRIYNIIDSMLKNDKPLFVKLKVKIVANDIIVNEGSAIFNMTIFNNVEGSLAIAKFTVIDFNFTITIAEIISDPQRYSIEVEVTG